MHVADDVLHRVPPPVVGHRMPLAFDHVPQVDAGQGAHESAVPVEYRAAGVEGQRLDVKTTTFM
jgi:hypothetical protein